jgi:hypothetical protein
VVSPVASLAVGAGLLGEAARMSAARGIAAGLAVLVTAAGLAGLARLASADPDPACRPASPRRPSGVRCLPVGPAVPVGGQGMRPPTGLARVTR